MDPLTHGMVLGAWCQNQTYRGSHSFKGHWFPKLNVGVLFALIPIPAFTFVP